MFESKDTATVTPPDKPISVEEFRLASEVLQLADMKTEYATMFIRQTVSQQYKKVSEDLNPALKKKRRKATMKSLLQQSLLHGAKWMGSNFIA